MTRQMEPANRTLLQLGRRPGPFSALAAAWQHRSRFQSKGVMLYVPFALRG
jgi:hypothetical protein